MSAEEKINPEKKIGRREFLKFFSLTFMFAGLAAGYGALAAVAGRYLYPSKPRTEGWLYVTEVNKLKPGQSISYRSPEGASIAVARQGDSGQASDFIALSSVCPHLGCQVHWEGNKNRFFCPCHNGVFNPEGKAISGPPAEAKQSLARYPLKVEGGLLYIQVPLDALEIHGENAAHNPNALLAARQQLRKHF